MSPVWPPSTTPTWSSWMPPDTSGRGGGCPIWLLRALTGLTADVVLVVGDPPSTRRPYAALFGGSEHDWAAAELGALLARANDTQLRIIGTISRDDDASRLIMRVGLAIQRAIGVPVEPVLVEPTSTSLLTALTGTTPMIGLSERWQTQGLGSLRYNLAKSTPGTLLSRRGLRPGLLATPKSSTRFAWSVASTAGVDQVPIRRSGSDP